MNRKNLLRASLFGMLALAFVFSGCEKNDDAQQDEMAKSVVGTWKYVKHVNITDAGDKDVMLSEVDCFFDFREDGTFKEYSISNPSFSLSSGTYELESNTLTLLRGELSEEQYTVVIGSDGKTLEMRWFVYTEADEDSSLQTTLCVSYYEKQ